MDFWTELVKIVVSNGIFAMLFVFLFFYQLKDSAKREESYRQTIESLTDHLYVLEQVRDEIRELKSLVSGGEDEEKNKILWFLDGTCGCCGCTY